MYEQLSIFDFLQPQEQSDNQDFSWDCDINEIYNRLLSIADKHNLSIKKAEWSIWSHVQQYGFRMWLDMEVTRKALTGREFMDEVNEVVDFAKKKGIELSPLYGAAFFFNNSDTATLSFSTMFMDKKRQEIRS